MSCVLDVSAAYELALAKPQANRIGKLIISEAPVLAPSLFYSEAANTAWKYYKAEQISLNKVELVLNDVVALVSSFVSDDELWVESFSSACIYSHSVYDLFYVILARRTNSRLISMDRKLLKLCEQLDVKT